MFSQPRHSKLPLNIEKAYQNALQYLPLAPTSAVSAAGVDLLRSAEEFLRPLSCCCKDDIGNHLLLLFTRLSYK